MAVIAPTTLNPPIASNSRLVVETAMTSSDTLVYIPGSGQELILRNPTAGALTVTLTGSASYFTNAMPGVPYIDLSTGHSTGSIPAGGVRAIPLDTIGQRLQGTVTLTGGTGMIAILLNPQ